MKVSGYEFREGALFQPGANLAAKEVGSHLEKLRKKLKRELTAKDVLNDAKEATSPLHSFFEWDDSAAAEQYRLSQAQGLITAVVAVYSDDDTLGVQRRAAVTVTDQQSAPVIDISPAASHDAVLRRAMKELQAWRKRYDGIAELAPVFSVADLVGKSMAAGEEQVAA